jgi:hypothetical protein
MQANTVLMKCSRHLCQVVPSTSRRPPPFTATATMTANDTMRRA